MKKQLKTLEQVKSEAYKIKQTYDGFHIYCNRGKYFINKNMFEYFGEIINVIPHNNENDLIKWDYECNDNWVYLKEWFEDPLFTDEDFII